MNTPAGIRRSEAASKQWDLVHRRIRDHGHALAADLVDMGATYRQVDYWVKCGYLIESRFGAGGLQTDAKGSGFVRGFTADEVTIAARAIPMVRDGLDVSVAFALARRGPGTHHLPHGTKVIVE